MRARHTFVLAALALLLSACGADAITGPEVREAPAGPAMQGGWMGGSGATQPPQDPESAS